MGKRILVIGTIAIDTILNVDRLPRKDGFGHVELEQEVPGGSSANVSVALHSIGNDVYQSGKVSDDRFGRAVRANLLEEGIHDEYLITQPGGTTLHTYIAVDPIGEHFILANSGNCVMNLEPEEIPDDLFDKIDYFYTDMASPRAGIYIARECHKRGIPVVFNMQNPPMESFGETKECFNNMLDYTSLFITGKTTICETTSMNDPVEAVKYFTDGHALPDGYVCTYGTKGSDWFLPSKQIHCDACCVPSIDTTGAGDCYIAGIIHAFYCQKRTREESMQFASRLAALKCMQSGPRLHYNEKEFTKIKIPSFHL